MEDNESSIRWQATTISQFTYASNLILTFTVASIGFMVSLILSQELNFSHCFYQYFYFLALLTFSISFLISICLILNRLKDFRDTTDIARIREESNNTDERLPILRAENKKLGKKTWCLFNWQLGTFSLAMILAVISFFNLILFRIG